MNAERTARKRFVLRRWVSSLTWKALAFITVMCCGLAALLGALVHVSVTDRTVSDARSRALARLDGAVRAYEAGNRLPPDSALDARGLPGPLRELAVSGRRGTMVGVAGGLPAMWAAAPADGGALAVRIDYAQSAATIENLDRAILGSSALAIGVTLAVGALGVTGVTRRLRTTSQVARRISAGDLDARVGDPRSTDPSRYRDEVAAVAAALDTMASTLQRKLIGEQRFTADVAHELRTPLTGLHAAAELLPPGRPTELVRDRVAALRTLTEDLLEISRLDAGGERLDVDAIRLGMLAGRVAAHASGDTEVRVVEDACVETDRRRLERVLGNLVANAHKHGRPPVVVTVEATAEEAVVTVRDHGDGFPGYLVAEGPQRFRTEGSRKGHGLGLTIAVGQAEVLGARLRFENAADGGASAVLRLPAGGD
jgi:signal transduction histidine kinase